MKAFIALAIFGVACAEQSLHSRFSEYKATHGKEYHPSVEAARLSAFAANSKLISEHNEKFHRGEVSYELGHNEHSDLSFEELRATRHGLVIDEAARASLNATEAPSMPGAPASVDWRGRCVTPPKNQASCGSCYTFSAAGAIESALLCRNRGTYDLSEQQMVDCTFGKLSSNFNFGCNGGDPAGTIQYAISNGASQESEYRYTSGSSKNHGQCRIPRGSVNIGMRMQRVSRGNENALAEALASYGPIAITLNGENNEFYNYRGGVYNNPACSSQINHAVLLVGYGEQSGQKFWIIKNSWGTTWGEGGYMKMAMGYNRCGIVSADSYYVA